MTDLGDRLRASAKRAIEALVLVAEEPLSSHLLAQLLEVSPAMVDELCRELADGYEEEGRGFQLVQVAGGWRYQTHPDQAPYVERLVLEGQSGKLSAAALETLAIVAYKQPLSRAQVASIRGVSVDGVMRTLQQRGYIDEVGKDPGPGQAVLFGTTRLFLEKLGLNSLDELPPLRDFVPSADIVEQLEQGLRPDREPLRPEDAMARDDELDELRAEDGDERLTDDELTGASVPDDLSGLEEANAADEAGGYGAAPNGSGPVNGSSSVHVVRVEATDDLDDRTEDDFDEDDEDDPDVEGFEPAESDDLDVVDFDDDDLDADDEEEEDDDEIR
ncbi:MAG TPA: SMC-Scp complex subunit ScpB [Acidimicrobiales bacterium]